jgi:hypothetical protein
MNNLNIYCLSIYPVQFNLFKKLKYIPVGLGKNNFSDDWLKDNTGNNISIKNPYYSEFTFHYWFWKNLIHTIPSNAWIGFCAYRRFWSNNDNLHSDEIDKIINIKNILVLVCFFIDFHQILDKIFPNHFQPMSKQVLTLVFFY